MIRNLPAYFAEDEVHPSEVSPYITADGKPLPWQLRRIVHDSPDLDAYAYPLPHPPAGLYWQREEDRSWVLKKYEILRTESITTVTFPARSVIEHVIMPSDTFQGICLRYRVSAVDLRRFNNFSGTAFRSKQVLRIPVEPGSPIQVQEDNDESIIQQRFMNATGESSTEANFYLSEFSWDLEDALR